MTHTKAILAMSSMGLGVALFLVAVQIERDRFAFTSAKHGKSSVLTNVTLAVPMPAATPAPAARVIEIPTIQVQALKVLPTKPRAALPAALPTPPENVEPARPPCNPQWRAVESGPSKRMVREICAPPVPDDVPRS